jgi:hypothetical protein
MNLRRHSLFKEKMYGGGKKRHEHKKEKPDKF